MPPMKIQPIDIDTQKLWGPVRNDSAKPVQKSWLRRLFDRQFHNVSRTSTSEKLVVAGDVQNSSKNGAGTEFEPSSVCLEKMVQNFIEETNEKQPSAVKFGRNRCDCFNGNGNDSSDDELDVFGGFGDTITSGSSGGDAVDVLKNLIPCVTVSERKLLADTAKIVEKQSKVYKRKDELRKIVTDCLASVGYNSSLCISKWEKSRSYPAGEYEYIDVLLGGERLFVEIDFRSEFEIARPTGAYKAILQSLPYIFIGKSDRLGQIVSIISESAKQSLKKKGMHVPPWRKAEYMRAKWLSPFSRGKQPPSSSWVQNDTFVSQTSAGKGCESDGVCTESDCRELELIFGERTTLSLEADHGGESDDKAYNENASTKIETDKKSTKVDAPGWQPPAIRPKGVQRTGKITGLASLLKD